VRAAERLGGFGALTARGRSTGLTDQGLRPRGDHARRGVVGPEHRLEVLAVFAAQYLEVRLNLAKSVELNIYVFQSYWHIHCDGFSYFGSD